MNSVLIFGRGDGIVHKHEKMSEWMCFNEKIDQELVVSFPIDYVK